MNPYVYRRKAVSLSVIPGKARNVLPGLLKSVMTSAISSSAAFAIVAFAGVGVAAMAMVAHSEIAGTAYEPAIKSAYTAQTHQPSVLGAVSYGYNQPKCTKAGACLNYQWINFNNDGWQAKIDYQLPAKYKTGYIRVNGWKFMDGISGSGSGYTGYDLEPGQRYTFTLYGRYGRLNYKLTSIVLTGPDAPMQQCPVQGAPAPTNCYYDYSSDPCGQLVCNPVDPVPPVYGYSSVPVPQPDRGWREGWIEQVYYGSDRVPGSMKIVGWVYDNANSLSWNGLQLALKNETTGASYNPVNISIEKSSRWDIQNYINQKLGITGGNALNTYIFIAKFDNLPAGTYSVFNARYNGFLFNNAHRGPYYITQPQPVYGYASPVTYGTNPGNNIRNVAAGQKDQALFSFRVYASRDRVLPITGFTFEIKSFPDGGSVDGLVSDFSVRDSAGGQTNISSVLSGGRANATFNGTSIYIQPNSSKDYTIYGFVNSAIKASQLGLTLRAITTSDGQFVQNSDFINGVIQITPPVPTAAQLKILAPNGGETWTKNTTITVKYLSSGLSSVNIYLKPYVACLYSTPRCMIAEINPYLIASNVVPTGSNSGDGSQVFNMLLTKDLSGRDIPEGAYMLQIASLNGEISDTSDQPFKVAEQPGATPRVGQIINNNGTVFYVGEGKIYGFPDLATFNSWGFSFSQLVAANDAEKALPNGGVVPMKDPRYSTPLEQIKAQQNPAVLAMSSHVFPVTQVKPGDVDVTVLKLLLTSDVNDAPVDTVSIQQDPGYAALTNFRIYNDAGVLLGSLDKLPYVAVANRNFGGIPLTNTLVIPRGTSKALIVKANIPADAQNKTKVKAIGLSTNSTQPVSYRLAENLDGPEIAIGNPAPVANNPKVQITSLTVDGSYMAGNSVLPVMWKVSGPSTMTLTGTTVIQLSSVSGNVRQEAARITANSVLNQDNFATFAVPANINPGSYKVVVNVAYSDPNYGYNLSLNAESLGMVNVTAAAGGSSSGNTVPKITFTANGQPSDLTVNVGDSINYQWAAVGAASLTSSYTANIADTCAGGANSVGVVKPWDAKTPTGSTAAKVQACQSGADYTILLQAPGFVDAKLHIKVNASAASNTTAKSLRYLKIETTSSNSWVAWREIEVYDATGTRQAPVSFSASSAYLNSTGEKTYDGNVSTVWNSGAYTGSITLDYGKTITLAKLRLLPANYPNPATETYNIQVSLDGSAWSYVKYITGGQFDNVWSEQIGPWGQ